MQPVGTQNMFTYYTYRYMCMACVRCVSLRAFVSAWHNKPERGSFEVQLGVSSAMSMTVD